jgi:predicted ATP-grasp superfamily ATP-dependent carboligase
MEATVAVPNVVALRFPTRERLTVLPPVIVLNLFYSGLGIVRQLSGTGVRVVGLSAHPEIFGNFTRLCEVRRSPNSQEQPEQLLRFLQDAALELKGGIIFPTRDADVLFLDRFRSELELLYRLPIPPREVLRRVLDKDTLARTAMTAGISVPRTATVTNLTELMRESEYVGFPCILKPVRSIHWRDGDNWKAVGGRKAFRASNLNELEGHYKRVARIRSTVLLQEWIPGGTGNLEIWGGYVGHGTDVHAYFTARKVLQSPGEFGTGCVVESEPISDLLEPSVRLCRALDYEGIAEIEYKRDPRDGILKFIEINVRHWDWHELGRASQINITWSAYCHLVGRHIEPVHTPTKRAKWVAEDVFVRHLWECVWQTPADRQAMLHAIAGKRIYGICDRHDPAPCICYSLNTLLPLFASAAVGKLKQVFNRAVTPHV